MANEQEFATRRELAQLREDTRRDHQELAQRVAEIDAHGTRGSASALIGRAEYLADQRGTERRFADLQQDISETRLQLADGMRAVNQRISDRDKTATEHRYSWRNAIFVGLIPALVVLLSVLVQIWLSGHGGRP